MTRRAALCLMILMSLCNGCAKREVIADPVYPVHCPKPARPELPKLGGLSFLESGRAYVLLKQRDRIIRDYIAGLEAALDCYEMQLPKAAQE